MFRSVLAACASAALMVTLCAGCDEHAGAPSVSGSAENAPVKGVVRIHGKAVENGTVTFNGTNIRRPDAKPVQAKIGKGGSYELKALVGQNYVEVDAKELHTAKNRVLAESQVSVMVNSGDNTIDVELPAKGP